MTGIGIARKHIHCTEFTLLSN